MARLLNDGIAEVERKHPTRFRGCIHLPIHEPEAAKRELERGIDELGLRAVALLACHLDVQLDNPTMNAALRGHSETQSARSSFIRSRNPPARTRFTIWIAACSGPWRQPRPSCA